MFNPGATGDATPDGTIGGDKTMLFNVRGMTLDAAGNLYVLSLAEVPLSGGALTGTPSILVFAPGATGNVAPTRVISGPLTGLGEQGTLRVDSAGNLYALSGGGVVKFAAGVSGNVAPTPAMVAPSATGSSPASGGLVSGFAVQ